MTACRIVAGCRAVIHLVCVGVGVVNCLSAAAAVTENQS
jgi:hypothetical protein